jgi:MFS family permease
VSTVVLIVALPLSEQMAQKITTPLPSAQVISSAMAIWKRRPHFF